MSTSSPELASTRYLLAHDKGKYFRLANSSVTPYIIEADGWF